MARTSLAGRATDLVSSIELSRLIWFAPVLFVAHVAEEAPGFVEWTSSVLAQGITDRQFLVANASGFLITVLLAIGVTISKDGPIVLVALIWLGFMMFANAILHATATIILGVYSPGTITSVFLYLPYFSWFVTRVLRTTAFRTPAICVAILVGAVPMLMHGYLIVFEGRTLFELP